MQPIERVAPAALVDQVVPLGNQIVDRAAAGRLAERHAAVHAAGALRACRCSTGGVGVDLEKVARPLERVAVGDSLAWELFESGGFAHRLDSTLNDLSQRRSARDDYLRAVTMRFRR